MNGHYAVAEILLNINFNKEIKDRDVSLRIFTLTTLAYHHIHSIVSISTGWRDGSSQISFTWTHERS